MKKLIWVTVGFIISLLFSVYILKGEYLAIFIAASAVLFVACVLLRKYTTYYKQIISAAVGFLAGFCWFAAYDCFYIQDAALADGQMLNTAITITDYSEENVHSTAANGEITIDGKDYKVRVYIYDNCSLKPGDVVHSIFTIGSTTYGTNNESNYYQSEGIFIVASASSDYVISHGSSTSISGFSATIRRHITDIIASVFPEDTFAFAQALLVGDSSGISYADNQNLQNSGIRHIIAVSGLHVSILFSLIYFFMGKRRVLTAIFGIPLLIVFAAVAGYSPSVVRACTMQLMMILAMLIKRDYDPPTALAFAVLIMLLYNPLAIMSISLQLSSCCIVGIFKVAPLINKFLLSEKRLGVWKGNTLRAHLARWFSGSVSVSLGTMIMTMPLCACYFGMISVVGVITNLLTLWIVTFIFYGIMIACLFGAIFLPIGQVIGWLISWLIRYVLFISDALGSLPFSAVYTDSPYVLLWIVLVYALLVLFFIQKKKHPWILSACISFSLFASILLSWLEPAIGKYRVTVFDVGQGQCILLQCDNHNYLIDCGGDSANAVATQVINRLSSQGIYYLDGLILTHYDYDHAGAAKYILSCVETGSLYVTNPDPDTNIDDEIYLTYSGRIVTVNSKTEIEYPNGKLSVFGASSETAGNDSSLCILFQTNNCDILITGDRNIDGEEKLLSDYDIGDVDILVAGHHGSASSTGMSLLSKTTPETVIISVGADNIHEHPTQDVLYRLEMFGCKILRTDINGEIVIKG